MFGFSLTGLPAVKRHQKLAAGRRVSDVQRKKDSFPDENLCRFVEYNVVESHTVLCVTQIRAAVSSNAVVCQQATNAHIRCVVSDTGRDELSPRGANCAPPTYVGRVLSSAREPSSQQTFRVWGCRLTHHSFEGYSPCIEDSWCSCSCKT